METINQIPKWFWIALGIIVLATIASIMYCNSRSKQIASDVSDSLSNGALTQEQRDAIKAEVKQDVFDLIPDLQAALNQ